MKGLLLLAFGGPRSLEEVELFLARLFRRQPSQEELERVKERYRLIGGCSPLLENTLEQAETLSRKLNDRGYPFKPYVGMRYCQPFIEEVFEQIIRDGIKEVFVLPMTPFQSRATTGAYVAEVNRVNKKLGGLVSVSFVKPWHCHPLFIEALRKEVEEGLLNFEPGVQERVYLLFTAHSLPVRIVQNDPYVKQVEETTLALLRQMPSHPWRIAYQSKGDGQEEWIGPDVEKILEEFALQEVKEVLLIPIGFLCDHVEILYDIDIALQQKAQRLGLILKRTRSLNASERLMNALASVIEEQLKETESWEMH